jgi:nitroreductase
LEKLLDLIRNRYSCRGYSDKAVEAEKVAYIKECVRLSPSAVNRQPWHFRFVVSKEGREKLQSCYSRPWFAEAPLYVIASLLHEEEWVRADGKAHGNIDVAIAVEHICLAATDCGLGSCWVCNFNPDIIKAEFPQPVEFEPIAIIPIGHIPEDGNVAVKTRKSLDRIVQMV